MAALTKTQLEQAHRTYKEAQYLLREAHKDEDRARGKWINDQTHVNMTAWVDAAERVEDYIARTEEAWERLYMMLEESGI